MALEIERKFMVKRVPTELKCIKEVHIWQGYLANAPGKTVRVRVIDSTPGPRIGMLTIKINVSDLCSKHNCREELEYEIPLEDAYLLLKNCGGIAIEKIRKVYVCEHGYHWEIDNFLDENNRGLTMAEVEMKSEQDYIPDNKLPEWLGYEVTNDPRYLNENLANRGFNTWGI
jgi:adenylate cyclase